MPTVQVTTTRNNAAHCNVSQPDNQATTTTKSAILVCRTHVLLVVKRHHAFHHAFTNVYDSLLYHFSSTFQLQLRRLLAHFFLLRLAALH
jgi:hypothetical protein